MEIKKLNIEDFKSNTLSEKEQKTIQGGDGDTIRGNGKGSTQPINI
ncbi:rSAM-modified peptide [Flavobacterium collinsii]